MDHLNNQYTIYLSNSQKITVSSSDSDITVEDFKKLINIKEHSFSNINLTFFGKQLENEKKLIDYEIKNGATIVGRLINEDDIDIKIKTLTGKVISFNINKNSTIDYLKNLIFMEEGIATYQTRLIFNGKQLEDDRTLNSYNVNNDSTIHLVLRLTGSFQCNFTVKIDESRIIQFRESDETQIITIKMMLEKTINVPYEQILLFSDGGMLQNDFLIKDYIEENGQINIEFGKYYPIATKVRKEYVAVDLLRNRLACKIYTE